MFTQYVAKHNLVLDSIPPQLSDFYVIAVGYTLASHRLINHSSEWLRLIHECS